MGGAWEVIRAGCMRGEAPQLDALVHDPDLHVWDQCLLVCNFPFYLLVCLGLSNCLDSHPSLNLVYPYITGYLLSERSFASRSYVTFRSGTRGFDGKRFPPLTTH